MKCNMCDSEDFKVKKIPRKDDSFTYIYSCQECPNIQFEYVDDEDLLNMIKHLYANLSSNNIINIHKDLEDVLKKLVKVD